MLLINEIFYTLQGEGTYIGHPSVFVRTSGCNLRCNFCDSYYTSWLTEGKLMSVADIYEKIKSVSPDGYTQHIVITGGEPLLQKELPELIAFLKSQNHFVTIETNGTIYNDFVKPDLFSISPKTSNSIPTENAKHSKFESWKKENKIHVKNNKYSLSRFLQSGVPLQIKFVICSQSDLKEIQSIIDQYKIPKHLVFLMPEGYTRVDQESKKNEIADICKKYGYIYCARLHVDLWDCKRGV